MQTLSSAFSCMPKEIILPFFRNYHLVWKAVPPTRGPTGSHSKLDNVGGRAHAMRVYVLNVAAISDAQMNQFLWTRPNYGCIIITHFTLWKISQSSKSPGELRRFFWSSIRIPAAAFKPRILGSTFKKSFIPFTVTTFNIRHFLTCCVKYARIKHEFPFYVNLEDKKVILIWIKQ